MLITESLLYAIAIPEKSLATKVFNLKMNLQFLKKINDIKP